MVQTFTPKLDGVVSCDLLLLGEGAQVIISIYFPRPSPSKN